MNYKFMEDEVPLIDSAIVRLPNSSFGELTLTNQNIIIDVELKVLFSTDTPEQKQIIYPLSFIKFYKDKPYIVRNNNTITIYIKDGDVLTIKFYDRNVADKFVSKMTVAAIDIVCPELSQQPSSRKSKFNIVRVVDDASHIAVTIAKTSVVVTDSIGKSAGNLIPKIKD